MPDTFIPILLLTGCALALGLGLLAAGRILSPGRPNRVLQMPYESGMDPIHDARRRFDVRFHLLAIAFLVFDVELLFLFPWAVTMGRQGIGDWGLEKGIGARVQGVGARGQGIGGEGPAASATSSQKAEGQAPPSNGARQNVEEANRHVAFAGGMVFLLLLTLGFVYDWRKRVFQWR